MKPKPSPCSPDACAPGSSGLPDFAAALGQRIDGLRVGICRNHFFGNNQSDVDAAIEAAIRFYRDAAPTMPATWPMVQ